MDKLESTEFDSLASALEALGPIEMPPAFEDVDVPSERESLPEAFQRVALSPISAQKKLRFLIAFSATPVMRVATKIANVSANSVYAWRKNDEAFKEGFEIAREIGVIAAESEAWHRAVDGTVEDVYGNLGQNLGTGVVGQKRVKSDGLMMFMLKAAAPEKYRERVEHSGPNGGPIPVMAVHSVVVDPKDALPALSKVTDIDAE